MSAYTPGPFNASPTPLIWTGLGTGSEGLKFQFLALRCSALRIFQTAAAWHSCRPVHSAVNIPKEERAHIPVSLRETNLRLPAPSVRLPLFPFSRAEAARRLSGIKAEAEARQPSKSLGEEKGPELGD